MGFSFVLTHVLYKSQISLHRRPSVISRRPSITTTSRSTMPSDRLTPTLLNQCLLTGSPTYCTSVFRDPNSGKLTRVDQVSINTATLITSGIDVESRYHIALPDAIGGSMSFALNWNWLQKIDVVNEPGSPTVHYRGQIAETPG